VHHTELIVRNGDSYGFVDSDFGRPEETERQGPIPAVGTRRISGSRARRRIAAWLDESGRPGRAADNPKPANTVRPVQAAPSMHQANNGLLYPARVDIVMADVLGFGCRCPRAVALQKGMRK
jgi:hypothetical protein